MALVLSANDLRALQPVLRLLSAPLESPSMPEWRKSLLAALAPMFAADAGVFVLSEEGRSGTDLLNLPHEYLLDYVRCQEVDFSADLMPDGEVAFTTESITRGDRRVYTETEIYSSLFRRYRIEDGVWTTFRGPAETPLLIEGHKYAPRGKSVQGTLIFYSERVGRPRFRSEGLALMELLHPMMQSAAQTWVDAAANRAGMSLALDEAPEGMALFGATGSTLHVNPVLEKILAAEADPAPLMESLRRLAVEYSSRRTGDYGRIVRAVRASEHQLTTGGGRYAARATSVEHMMGLPRAVLVSVRPQAASFMSGEELRYRYGLTRTEIIVAHHLTTGAGAPEVASRMGISVHTVRRHSERIRRKLGVSTQLGVAAIVLRRDQ